MRVVLLVLILAVGACTSDDPAPTTSPVPVPPPPPATATTTTSTAPVPLPLCPGEEGGFVTGDAGGVISGRAGDAAALTTMAVAPLGACERLTVTFASEGGAPATTLGSVDFELRGGVLRITMPEEVTTTEFANLVFEGLVDRVYVTVTEQDRLRVDVHLASDGPVQPQVLPAPARLVVDAAPGAPLEDRPTYGTDAVLLTPTSGAVGYPLAVEGYVRGRAAAVEVTLEGDDGNAITESLPSVDFPWRAFSVQFPSGPTGDVRLTVGDIAVSLQIG